MQKESSLLKSGYVLVVFSYLILITTFFISNSAGLATLGSTAMGVIHLVGIVLIWLAKRKASGEDLKHCTYIIRAFWVYNLWGLVFLMIGLWAAFQVIQIEINPTTQSLDYVFIEDNLMIAVAVLANIVVAGLTVWYFIRTSYGAYHLFSQKELNYSIKKPISWKDLVNQKFLVKEKDRHQAANDDG